MRLQMYRRLSVLCAVADTFCFLTITRLLHSKMLHVLTEKPNFILRREITHIRVKNMSLFQITKECLRAGEDHMVH